MTIFCHICGTKNTNRETCANCNTPLVLDRNRDGITDTLNSIIQVECPWCKTVNKTITKTHCSSCGGPLPEISQDNSGVKRGSSPPPVPRQIPKKYIQKLKYRNTLFIIGIFFIVPFFWSVIFPIIGFFLVKYSLKVANRKLEALEKGIATEGRLEDIYRDHSESVNGRHPWRLDYTFKTKNGQIIEASKTGAWNPNNAYRRPKDKLWVVYLENNPETNAIWPPVD